MTTIRKIGHQPEYHPHEVYLDPRREQRKNEDMFAEYFKRLEATFVLPRGETKKTLRIQFVFFNHIERS